MNREPVCSSRLLNRRYEKSEHNPDIKQNFADWGEMFGDNALATAIPDRLLHHLNHSEYKRRKLPVEGKTQSRSAG